jgi:hypothetical protein
VAKRTGLSRAEGLPSTRRRGINKLALNKQVKEGERDITLHYRSYVRKGRLFSGGPDEYAYWMSKDDILAILAKEGFTNVVMGLDEPQLSRGPGCSFIATTSAIQQAR